jgi:hypothetical protein
MSGVKFTANITKHELNEANKRMDELLAAGPHAVAAHYDRDDDRVVIDLNSGITLSSAIS